MCNFRLPMMNRGRSIRKRKYSEELLKYGFAFIVDAGIKKLQCVICNEIMTDESMKPNKRKRHFDAKHPNFAGKDVQYFKKADGVKKTGLILAASSNSKIRQPLKLHIWWFSESPNPRNFTPLPRNCCCQQPKTLFQLCLELNMLTN